MASSSRAYEGNFKAYLLSTAPADWLPATNEISASEVNAGTRLLRLISNGGVAVTENVNTASQALVDEGKIRHNLGTREISGLQIVHERSFPVADDTMYNFYSYGDKRWLVVSPDGEPSNGDVLHVFEIEAGDPEVVTVAQDTIQNFQVTCAVQEWNHFVVFTT
jgi:hypothetical protein